MVEEVLEGTSFAATTRNGAARVEPSSHGQLGKKELTFVSGLSKTATRKIATPTTGVTRMGPASVISWVVAYNTSSGEIMARQIAP